ncbi:PIN domain-containing protein [Leptospira langatensis]|nr:PIN domain-containing protein [Leptospira langatensis]TGK01812.1 hypothetical protein EHO57_08410 [Leptospira langatensis]
MTQNIKPKLLFVDTNILLDFYRVRDSKVSKELINKLIQSKDKLILTEQVEMEFKKNRQKAILETIKSIKSPNWDGLIIPPIMEDSDPSRVLNKTREQSKKQIQNLKKRIMDILVAPSSKDSVFTGMNKIFEYQSDLNLNRGNKLKYTVRKLARKRFALGFPPRKDSEISLGDAINWEWIIYCAKEKSADVIIVSRDSDFGISYENHTVINDWLHKEFKERVGYKKIILSNKLTEGLKFIDVSLSEKAKNFDAEVQKEYSKSTPEDLLRISPVAYNRLLDTLNPLDD